MVGTDSSVSMGQITASRKRAEYFLATHGSDVVGWVDFEYASTTYGTCTPAYTCSGSSTIIYTGSSCQPSTYATCTSPSFCSAGSSQCLYTPLSFIQSGDYSGHLQAAPLIVPTGLPTTLFWNVSGASSCTVSGNDGENFSNPSSGTNGQATAPINQQTIFTLVCTPDDPSATFTPESVTVNVLPVFEER